jgi:acyl-CoA synthetase (AMP-forming)/AMP-acid ligase II
VKNVIEYLHVNARKFPTKVAIQHKGHFITYANLEDEVFQTAAYFQSKGIKAGDRVLVFVPMSIDLYRIVLALFKIGATAVFLDEWVNKERMELCCRIAECRAFIGIWKARLLSFFSKDLRKIPIKLGISYEKVPINHSGFHQTDPDDTALITFTTGSTGTPKAAKRTHAFLLEQFNALIEEIYLTPNAVDLSMLPIFVLCNLGIGSTTIIPDFKATKPDSLSPEQLLNLISLHKINRISASPFVIKKLAEYVIKTKANTNELKNIFTGGAPVFPKEAQLYARAFPNSRVEILYGSTEAEPISKINIKTLLKQKTDLLKDGLNVGKPTYLIKVKIITIKDEIMKCRTPEDMNLLEVSNLEIGEIAVSGDHVLKEYYNNEEALMRNKIFAGDEVWHRTGDSGYVGNDGSLYLTGRCNQLIWKNDQLIAPFLYENFLQTIVGVEIGTILHLKDKLLIVLELSEKADQKRIEKEIKNSTMVHDEIRFIDKIPRDQRHNSKIDYPTLEKQLD